MKIILSIASLLILTSQIFANYDPSDYNDYDYDDSKYSENSYDDRGDYDDSDYEDDSSNEQQDPNQVWIDSRDLVIPKNDCFIKGNISDIGEKIYHIPGCDYYKETIISKEGEMYFCSEYEAFKAGFRKAMNCPNVQLVPTSIGTIKDKSIDRTIDPIDHPNIEKILMIPLSILILLLIFSETLRIFLQDSIIYVIKLFIGVIKLLMKISAIFLIYIIYFLKIYKYHMRGHDLKIRYIKTWISSIEKSGSEGYFKTLMNYYLCKLLKSKLK